MSEQITITLKRKQGPPLQLNGRKGQTLLDAFKESGVELPSLCSAKGKCGRCVVRFPEGAPLPSSGERAFLSPDRLRQGYRLACLARPVQSCVVETAFVEGEEPPVLTRFLPEAVETGKTRAREVRGPGETKDKGTESGEGRTQGKRTVIAADLGTTTIAMQLLDADSGRVWDAFTCRNPQTGYGADVISRIRAAEEGKAQTLRQAVIGALEQGIGRLSLFAAKRGLEEPGLAVIGANTVMGHLLMGWPAEGLGKSPFLPAYSGWGEGTLGGIPMTLFPPISAFIGGDVVSGLYACGLMREPAAEGRETTGTGTGAWLFMDLGTNAEMALGWNGRLFCTAAAAGPAFEGGAFLNEEAGLIRTGTGAERLKALAALCKTGTVDRTGLLVEPYFEKGITVDGTGLTQRDIREIQLAKAAIRAGIHLLMEEAGVSGCDRVERVYLSGGFGFYLDREAASRVGLVPKALKDKLVAVGNSSLAGAGRYALSKDKDAARREIEEMCRRAAAFNLAARPDFEEIYIRYMDFE